MFQCPIGRTDASEQLLGPTVDDGCRGSEDAEADLEGARRIDGEAATRLSIDYGIVLVCEAASFFCVLNRDFVLVRVMLLLVLEMVELECLQYFVNDYNFNQNIGFSRVYLAPPLVESAAQVS